MKSSTKYSLGMNVAHYLIAGSSVATLMISSFGYYETGKIAGIDSVSKIFLEEIMQELKGEKAAAKSELERCLASSRDCSSLSLGYTRLHEAYADKEKSLQKVDERFRSGHEHLAVFTLTSALGIAGLAYAFKKKEKEERNVVE